MYHYGIVMWDEMFLQLLDYFALCIKNEKIYIKKPTVNSYYGKNTTIQVIYY